MASGAHSICHGDCGRSQWRAAASRPFIFTWKRSDLETSDSFYLENWQFLPASQPPWMSCNPFLMLPTWNAVLQDKNFLAVNEFSNELSFQNSEEMPSDMLGSAKQEGNGSSVPTVINRMWFVYSPHLLSTAPCQGCASLCQEWASLQWPGEIWGFWANIKYCVRGGSGSGQKSKQN